MLAFPNIAAPEFGNFDEDYEDQTISSVSEAKYRISRPRTTRMPGKWRFGWNALSDANYLALMAFWRNSTHGTAEMFLWTNPKWGTTHSVRFASKPAFRLTEYGWQGAVEVEEV